MPKENGVVPVKNLSPQTVARKKATPLDVVGENENCLLKIENR